MKKVVIPVIIIVFGICAFLGFKAASKILSTRQSPDEQATATINNPTLSQKNYVFIHVNNLTVEKPELISVWVGFVNESSPPQFSFLPIFPAKNAEVHNRVKQSFSLDSTKKVNQRFIKQLQSSFDFKINGYILSDDTGVSYSNQWVTGVEAAISSTEAATDEEKHALLLGGQTSWQQFCNLVSTGTANTYFSAINWGKLLPEHFSTDLDFESITLLTDQIVHATGPVKCDVLSNE
jgi:hypothetical protein